MSVNLERVGWEDGTLVTPARVTTSTGTYDVTEAQYSGTTPLSAENLKAMEDNTENAINEVDTKYKPELIYCNPSQNVDFGSDTYTDISNWVKKSGVGENLTINNGKILIGQGIHHIKVTYKLWAESIKNSDLLYTYGRKNNTDISGSWQIHYLFQQKAQSVYNQFVIDVQEGDIITASVYIYETVTIGNNSSIIVEKID